MPQFKDFIQLLQKTNPPANCVNPYQLGPDANAVRCHNLQLYLATLFKQKPTHILIGEAPGHRGCRLSGIPFVSPYILVNGAGTDSFFGLERGFLLPDDCTAIMKEASATIVWQTIATLKSIPLLWNAFPFHPHQPDRPFSNRSPNKSELAIGIQILEQLTTHFKQPVLVAVGKKAQQLLTEQKLAHYAVRHPSFGGKSAFVKGLQDIFRKS